MIGEIQTATTASGHSDVLSALRTASAETGSDFDYLLRTAMRESGLEPQAKSNASSATGLFQFTDQTWLGVVKRFGSRHGLGAYADAIQQDDGGRYTVTSKPLRQAILALRQDPHFSALMAGESAHETRANLEGSLGRLVCCGELYAAHFLGEGGARHLIALNESTPSARADLAFPQAAKANHSVFYNADGTPRTIGQIYAWAVDLPAAPVSSGGAQYRQGSTPLASLASLTSVLGDDSTPISAAARASLQTRLTDEDQRPAAPPSWRTAIIADHRLLTQTATLLPVPFVLTPGVVELLGSLNPAGVQAKRES